ncbi:MAG: hypothetical protein G01um101433_985 [Parcubacteria group bacterium Gr01-1014_33]|nr:MAG: hypothetical protein G01um101433_985 [Parcubacteria group bacterium Gr01-1014_33]
MKTTIKGQSYNFCIVANGMRFYIKALHRASSRFSFINNLNTILSEFNINVDDKRVSESQWLIPKKQGGLFFKKAVEFLLSRNSRSYIERKLDEDRECGEWENS